MGRETSKAFDRRRQEGYFTRFLTGRGIDIGCGDDPITPDCLAWDQAQGDAQTLPGLAPAQFDWVYSSHCLEDLPAPRSALRRWWEVLKPGGYLLVSVPDEDLYEQGQWPSRFNGDHRWTFTIHKSGSWSPRSLNLADLLAELPGHRIRSLRTCDAGYDPSGGVWDRTHGPAEAALEALVWKCPADAPESRPCPATWDQRSVPPEGIVSEARLRIYTGILGQIGDVIMFTPTLRRLKELFPNGRITVAVSRRYQEAGELVAGLPYVDRLFITERYFENLTEERYGPWHLGWPVDLRGPDEIAEQARHDLVFETRPRHRRGRWWEHAHQVVETAHTLRIPGPLDLRTEIAIPSGTRIPAEWRGKVVLHNDPTVDATKAWPWESVRQLVQRLGPEPVVLLGHPGPDVDGALDLRGRTSLAEAAAVIEACRGYIGIDSGLMWIAASLGVPAVGLYGTTYIPVPQAVQPVNPRARYLTAQGVLAGIPVEEVLLHVSSIVTASGR
jgi:ADP-heptose:LPS heptosyltransferase